MRGYQEEKHSCLLCDYLKLELQLNARVVCQNDAFAAVVPFWAVWPFESLVLSKRHLGSLEQLSGEERDLLGDNLPPDYLTRVKEGAFYGWPWYYTGAHEDPRHKGARPDLAGKVTVPDVLLQPHSAPLGMTFYNGNQFPAEFKGQAFAASHGSWNRTTRTGYKIIRVIVKDGVPTGEYEDFVTGFVTQDGGVWGRPVGVAIAKDGALLFSEDGNGTIWRVSYAAK